MELKHQKEKRATQKSFKQEWQHEWASKYQKPSTGPGGGSTKLPWGTRRWKPVPADGMTKEQAKDMCPPHTSMWLGKVGSWSTHVYVGNHKRDSKA